MDTPARIYYKYEGGSPSGSHKPNTAVAQAYYNKEVGVTRLATETGAGQWGSALSFACQVFGMECKVYMVRVSYEQKPYRKVLMQTWGAEVGSSPSPDTNAGRRILARQPGQHRQPRYCYIGGGGRCRHARRAAGLIEAVNVQQRAIFEAALSFTGTEGILPAPEPAHAILGAMQEALACKESGESKVIVFNMCGHGHFNLAAYEQHLADNLEDFDYPEEAIRASLKRVPSL